MSKVAYRRKKKDLPKRKIEKKSGMNDLAVTPSCPALSCPVLFPYERVSFSTNNNLNQAQQKPEQIFPLPSKTEGPKKEKKKRKTVVSGNASLYVRRQYNNKQCSIV